MLNHALSEVEVAVQHLHFPFETLRFTQGDTLVGQLHQAAFNPRVDY